MKGRHLYNMVFQHMVLLYSMAYKLNFKSCLNENMEENVKEIFCINLHRLQSKYQCPYLENLSGICGTTNDFLCCLAAKGLQEDKSISSNQFCVFYWGESFRAYLPSSLVPIQLQIISIHIQLFLFIPILKKKRKKFRGFLMK